MVFPASSVSVVGLLLVAGVYLLPLAIVLGEAVRRRWP